MAGNLLAGNPRAAATAALHPTSLSPEEARTLIQRMGYDKGPFAQVFEALTNPVVVIGAALSLVFPVVSLKGLWRVSDKVRRAASKTPLLPLWFG